MSRSYTRFQAGPVLCVGRGAMSAWRSQTHRRHRRAVAAALAVCDGSYTPDPPPWRKISDPWTGPGDG